MGVPSLPLPVKLVVGLLSPFREKMAEARKELEAVYGDADSCSEPSAFNFTAYYEGEMGTGILRQYISFRDLVEATAAAAVKCRTNRIEREMAVDGRRTVNIDPGYITATKIVLTSTKDAPSRVYLGDGIYGQPMLRYHGGSYQPWEWTYPDYRAASAINFFNSARTLYKKQIRDGS